MIETIEYTGSALAFFGAYLLAKNTNNSKWGFVAYLVSNMFFIAWSIMFEVWGILTMNLGFLVINIYGIKKWFFDSTR
jgi:hypothetical protein